MPFINPLLIKCPLYVHIRISPEEVIRIPFAYRLEKLESRPTVNSDMLLLSRTVFHLIIIYIILSFTKYYFAISDAASGFFSVLTH